MAKIFNKLYPTQDLWSPIPITDGEQQSPPALNVAQNTSNNLDFSNVNPDSLRQLSNYNQPEYNQPPQNNNSQNLDFSNVNPDSLNQLSGVKTEIDPALKKELLKRKMYGKIQELEAPHPTTLSRFKKNFHDIPVNAAKDLSIANYFKEAFLPTLNRVFPIKFREGFKHVPTNDSKDITITNYFKGAFLPALDQSLRNIRADSQLATTPLGWAIDRSIFGEKTKPPKNINWKKRKIKDISYRDIYGNRLSYSTIAKTNYEMAQKMFKGESEWGDNVKKYGKTYLKEHKVGGYGGNPIRLIDIGVISSLAIFNMFGDPFLEAGAANKIFKDAKELALWKKVGQLEKELPTGVRFIKPQTVEIPLGEDLKIKIEPHKSEIRIKGFVKREWNGRVIPPNKLRGVYSDATKDLVKIVKNQTGADVTGVIRGNDLILQPTIKSQVIASQAGFAKIPTLQMPGNNANRVNPIKEINGEKVKQYTHKTVYNKNSIMKGEYNNKPYTTDTYIMEFNNIDVKKTRDRSPSSKDVQEMIIDKLKGGKKISVQNIIKNKQEKELFANFNDNTAIDLKYYNYFSKKYPNAEFKSNGNMSPVGVYSGNNLVGVVMPIKDPQGETIKTIKTEVEKPKVDVPEIKPGKDGKVAISDILDNLISKARKEDTSFLKTATETVDNLKQSYEVKKDAIKEVKRRGYEEYAHFLEWLEADHTYLRLSDDYLKKLNKKTQQKPTKEFGKLVDVVKKKKQAVSFQKAAEKIVKRFHPDDRAKMIEFIDNVRLKKPENIELEKDARAIAEGVGLNPDVSNLKLANEFDNLLKNQRAEFKKSTKEFGKLVDVIKKKQLPIAPTIKQLSPKEMQLLLPSAKGYHAGKGFTIKPGRTRTAKQILSAINKKISPEKIKYKEKLNKGILDVREKFVEQLKKEKAKQLSIENRKQLLTDYIKQGIPDPTVRKTFVNAVNKVKTDKQLAKQFERVDKEATKINKKRIINRIYNELKTSKEIIKNKLKYSKFTADTQQKLNTIRENISNSRDNANTQKEDNILAYTDGKMSYDDMMDSNAMLDMQGVEDMGLGELKNVLDNIKSLKDTGRTIREMEKFDEQTDFQMKKDRIMDILTGKKGLKAGSESVPRSELTAKKGAISKAIDIVDNWQLGWDDLLDKLSKFDKSSDPYKSDLSKFGDDIHKARNAQNKGELEYLTKVQEKMKEIFEVKNRRELNGIINKMINKKIYLGSFKNADGNIVPIDLTKEQIIQKYQQLKSVSNEDSFDIGMKWTDEIKDAINNALVGKYKKWADWHIEFYHDYLKKTNPIYRKIFNTDLFSDPNYVPSFRDVEADIPEDVLLAREASRYSSVVNGSLKAKVKNSLPLKFDEADAILANHIVRMEHFKAWAETMKNMRRMFGDKDIRKAIRQYHGDNILNTIDKYLNQMARDGIDKATINKGADFLRRNFVTAVIGLPNVAIGIKQLPSSLAYITEMPTIDYFAGVANFWSNPLKHAKFLTDRSPSFTERFGNGYERDIKFLMKKGLAKQLSGSKNFQNRLMSFVRFNDRVSVMQGSWAKYKSELKIAKSMGKDITNEKVIQDAIFKAEASTRRTQPTSGLETLSSLQRAGSWLKLFTTLSNQTNKYYRMMSTNARNMRYGRIKKAKGLYNILLAWLILPALFQFIGDAFQFKEKHMKKILYLGFSNDFLVVNRLIQSIYGWLVDGDTFDAEVIPAFSTLGDLKNAVVKIRKILEDYQDPYKKVKTSDVIKMTEYSSLVGGKVLGYPTPAIIRIEKGARREKPLEMIFSKYALEGDKSKKNIKFNGFNDKLDFSKVKLPSRSKFNFSNVKGSKLDFSKVKLPSGSKLDFSNVK